MPTVKLQDSTMSRLMKHGQFKDTWDAIINRIMDENEERKITSPAPKPADNKTFRLSREEVRDLEKSIERGMCSMSKEYEREWLLYKEMGEHYPFRSIIA